MHRQTRIIQSDFSIERRWLPLALVAIAVTFAPQLTIGAIIQFEAGDEVAAYDETGSPSSDGQLVFKYALPVTNTISTTVGGTSSETSYVYQQNEAGAHLAWTMQFSNSPTSPFAYSQADGHMSFVLDRDANYRLSGTLRSEANSSIYQLVDLDLGDVYIERGASGAGTLLDLGVRLGTPSEIYIGNVAGMLAAGEHIFAYTYLFGALQPVGMPPIAIGELTLDLEFVPVPEPHSIILLIGAVSTCLLRQLRRGC